MIHKETLEDTIQQRINHYSDASPEDQVKEAVRTIGELEQIDSVAAFRKVQTRIQPPNRYLQFYHRFARVAAILFIPLLGAVALLMYQQTHVTPHTQYAMQEVSSPPGIRSQVILPDGSHVWLNAESTLRFKVPFDANTRDVSLSGEAFFEVKKNPRIPFRVRSGDVSIKVLGTKFNCKAFHDENSIEVVLAEGCVSLDINQPDSHRQYVMAPGERAVVDKESGITNIRSEKIDKYIAWHQGKLVFDDALLSEVAKDLSRWYGVDVTASDPSIGNYRITTTFENESLQQVIDLLKLSSPINIQWIPAAINGNVQTRSKIIFSKKRIL